MCASPQRLCNTAFSELVCSVFQGWLHGPGLTIIFAVASRRRNDRLARLSNRQHKHIQVYTWLQQTHISFYCRVRGREGEKERFEPTSLPRCLTASPPLPDCGYFVLAVFRYIHTNVSQHFANPSSGRKMETTDSCEFLILCTVMSLKWTVMELLMNLETGFILHRRGATVK